jgi:hypothetical protein
MSVSQKQLLANRQNAQKSTGPRTPEGKAVSSRNAVKHGLYARDTVITSKAVKEDEAEYDLLFQSMLEELKPTTTFQEYLVRKMANCLWRSRRAVAAETATINRGLDELYEDFHNGTLMDYLVSDYPDEPPDDRNSSAESHSLRSQARRNLIGSRLIPGESFSNNVLRYEMRLDHQLTRTYKLLRQLQAQSQTESQSNSEDHSSLQCDEPAEMYPTHSGASEACDATGGFILHPGSVVENVRVEPAHTPEPSECETADERPVTDNQQQTQPQAQPESNPSPKKLQKEETNPFPHNQPEDRMIDP